MFLKGIEIVGRKFTDEVFTDKCGWFLIDGFDVCDEGVFLSEEFLSFGTVSKHQYFPWQKLLVDGLAKRGKSWVLFFGCDDYLLGFVQQKISCEKKLRHALGMICVAQLQDE